TVRTEIYRARLVVEDVRALTSHQRILLMVATYRTVPRLLRAELSFAGIACGYHTAGDVDVADNYLVVFERDADCSPSGATGEATLLFRLRDRARLALVTFIGSSPPPRDALVLASPALAAAHLS